MTRTAFLLYVLGLMAVYVMLEMAIYIDDISVVSRDWQSYIIRLNDINSVVASAAMISFLGSFGLRLQLYRRTKDMGKTIISFCAISAILIYLLKCNGNYWYFSYVLGVGVASLLANPFSLNPVGTLETMLRLIPVSGLSLIMILGLEVGGDWITSIVFTLDNIRNFIIVVHVLAYLPLIVLLSRFIAYGSMKGGYIAVSKLIICGVFIGANPGEGDTFAIIPLVAAYILILFWLIPDFIRSIDMPCGGIRICRSSLRERCGLSDSWVDHISRLECCKHCRQNRL